MFPSRLEYRSVLTILKISANDGPSTVFREAITAALSSLACKINICFISCTVKENWMVRISGYHKITCISYAAYVIM